MTPYQLLAGTGPDAVRADAVLRTEDGALIPADPGNRDWQAYRAWCAAGNSPTPPRAPDPAEVPVTGNRWALALGDLGLAGTWLAAVAASKP